MWPIARRWRRSPLHAGLVYCPIESAVESLAARVAVGQEYNRRRMKIIVLTIAVAAGCGRLDFEEVGSSVQLLVGSSTADLELCLGGATYWITSAPIAPG